MNVTLPLHGVRVLDLSTELPGPLATSILASAGAQVIKIERPGGDRLRDLSPQAGATSAAFHLLNHGKMMFTADLKDSAQRERVRSLAARADVVVEQSRPGVADRLGVGYRSLSALNPKLVHCSITGYGQEGAARLRAGHDLTYLADSGLLHLITSSGVPALPPGAVADIAGGSYPAVTAILLALRRAETRGVGEQLDISMTHLLEPFAYAAIAERRATGRWPAPGTGTYSGGDPRYAVYSTKDGRHVAVAALEQPFWGRLCDLLDLGPEASSGHHLEETRTQLQRAFSTRTAAEWAPILDQHDVCTRVVATAEEAEEAGLLNVEVASRGDCEIGDLALAGVVAQVDGDSRAGCAIEQVAPPLPDDENLWSEDQDKLCSVRHTTRLSLSDTDATGAWQFDVVLRLVQAAEIELLRQQGVLRELGGQCPRVYVHVDYTGPARFDDELVVELELLRLGRSSLHYRFTVRHNGKTVASGKMGTAHVVGGSSAPLPAEVRRNLHE